MRPLLALLLLLCLPSCDRRDDEDLQREEDVDERDFYESDSFEKSPLPRAPAD